MFRKVTAVKNFLFSRNGYSVEISLQKRSYSKKITPAQKVTVLKKGEKSSCYEEIAAPEK